MKNFGFLALILLAITSSALAETYPDKSKTFKIIVPFGPAGRDWPSSALFSRSTGGARVIFFISYAKSR